MFCFFTDSKFVGYFLGKVIKTRITCNPFCAMRWRHAWLLMVARLSCGDYLHAFVCWVRERFLIRSGWRGVFLMALGVRYSMVRRPGALNQGARRRRCFFININLFVHYDGQQVLVSSISGSVLCLVRPLKSFHVLTHYLWHLYSKYFGVVKLKSQ